MTEKYSDTEMIAHLISLGHDRPIAQAAIERFSDDLTDGGFRCYFEQDAATLSEIATKIAKRTTDIAWWHDDWKADTGLTLAEFSTKAMLQRMDEFGEAGLTCGHDEYCRASALDRRLVADINAGKAS